MRKRLANIVFMVVLSALFWWYFCKFAIEVSKNRLKNKKQKKR